ncbi:restriction endonuclease subunit S [Microlunatus capsulatus]|uniref:Type I restriction enzyme S subunit n=1 Tax=Microlunatus capsulatus TaxID=99117 RepID=A0ABS4ZBD0_9ACTN|nr:restriction endonuclease subunit S [Microlunatus capsulatus]MBP2417508.1 type I restriction enzyme S subunit [Microlunatus capsulatus]
MTEMTRLDRVATVHARIGWKALTADEYVDDGFAFLSTPNIKQSVIDYTNVNFISDFRYTESPELQLQIGDVLLAKDGSTLGIANCVRHLPRPATVNGSIAVLRPFNVESRYLMYWLQASPIQAQIQQLKDGMGVPHLFQQDIRKLQVPELNRGDQRRIADLLDNRIALIDRIVAARREQIGKLVQAREAHLQQLHDNLVSQYGECRLGYLLVGLEQGWSPQADSVPAAPQEWGVMRSGCVNGGLFRPDDNKRLPDGLEPRPEYEIRSGDLLMSRASGSLDLIGSVAVVPGGTRSRLLLCDKIYRIAPAEGWDARYLAHIMRTRRSREGIRLGVSGAEGMANNLPSGVVRDLRIPLVPSVRQPEIIDRAEAIHKREAVVTAGLTRSIRLLIEYRSSLITAAVTGATDMQQDRILT